MACCRGKRRRRRVPSLAICSVLRLFAKPCYCGAVAAEGVGEEVVPGAEHRGAGEKDEDFDADELGKKRVNWGERGISFGGVWVETVEG